MRHEVLVIGAGPAGISSAYYLTKAGIPFRLVDRADVPASTWANLYPTLELNTAGFVSHLPGRRIPLSYGVFPSGKQFYRYILNYLKQYPLPIEYGVDVTRVAPEGDGWRVETNKDSDVYPAVILATGRFGSPYMPSIPGQEAFTGQLMHAHDFHAPERFAGQRVLVVGSGPSGVDIAVALVGHAAKPVYLAIRSDILIARKFPYGLPNTVWQILLYPLPERVRKPLNDKIVYQGYGDMDDLSMKFARNRDQRLGTFAPVRGHQLIDAVRAGDIQPVNGLARLYDRCAVLDDTTQLEIDTVILGTGYRPVIEFLDFPYQMDEADWHLEIDRQTYQVKGCRGLYLVGWYYRGLGPLHNIRHEAQTVVQQIQRTLPYTVARRE